VSGRPISEEDSAPSDAAARRVAGRLFAVTYLVGLALGRPWTWVWDLGLPLLGAVFHVSWCLAYGITP
jgi:hypothetical protein